MAQQFKRYTLTAALPYANGPKHIGHLAGAYLPADVYARYLRAQKRDVVFVCGSDEHGTAIANQAMKEGTTPQTIIDKYHELNKKSFEELGISFDIFHRTSSPLHHETAQEFFTNLNDRGLLTEEVSEQYYDAKAEAFLADRYIYGTCPNCGHDHAYGDQCEKCGKSLSPLELINPKSTLTNEKPVMRSTKHWYLPLDKYEPFLREWILEGHKNDWKTNVYGQCKSWIDGGLLPRAVTRDLDWGIKVPVKDAEGKVLYVWFDAPIGYISATKQWAIDNNKNWKDYWQSPDSKLVHFIGKDNIVFHCIIFPAMLHAHGDYILPQDVPGNEFMNLEGDKMSTSRGWSIEMHEYLHDFPNQPDLLRFTLMSILPETKDSEFTWKDFQAKTNNELVAIFGNFVNRTVVLTEKYFDSKVPEATDYTKEDLIVLQSIEAIVTRIEQAIEGYRMREAMAEALNLARLGNKYLADNEPWKLIKTDEKRVKTIMNISLQLCASLSIAWEPFLPFSTLKLKKMLGFDGTAWHLAKQTNNLATGHIITNTGLLFNKIEDTQIELQVQKLKAKAEAIAIATKVIAPIKPNVTFDDFSKLDIRIGTILEAERVPKTDKLLKLKIDTGIDQRTVVSGIAGSYDPKDIIGQQVSILVNLEPRTIKGIESQGMILMTENIAGKLSFVAPTNTDVEIGAEVR
ncbi:MAG: methionine--tRNA ligase [Bacteroidia bacterium]|nr:methionine--tRNA ligase [Bacteroidia bacterium]